ncbi:hypothetical protein PSCLAVI8L_190018 [Pseudoclavibacter sp. 8L]|nr:hypothetical protein PSCLAVI8L_190018 [Pseudoclavibacter sp. 8L]
MDRHGRAPAQAVPRGKRQLGALQLPWRCGWGPAAPAGALRLLPRPLLLPRRARVPRPPRPAPARVFRPASRPAPAAAAAERVMAFGDRDGVLPTTGR